MMDHLRDPQAISWEDMQDELGFTDDERARIDAGAKELIAQARAYRLAEVRRRQHATQTDIAKAMGVTQARVSRIEKGELTRSEVDTLAAYVHALGGKLKIIADFGDESYVLG
ncbi:XRE family transcriptional regulator [Dactylosporangium sp. CA-233914]|uniref:XRE family transcriptional regulator n=1 Tax=Dactylosporangium sp. CA-233914 TaxID=3239934 RepID=UPI003D94C3A1